MKTESKPKIIIFLILWGCTYILIVLSSGCFTWSILIFSFCLPGFIFGILFLQDILNLIEKKIRQKTAKTLKPETISKPLLIEQSKTIPESTNALSVKCPYCGAQYPVGTNVCPLDNYNLSSDPSAGNLKWSNVVDNILKISAGGLILFLLWWFFSTEFDASTNRNITVIARFLSWIFTKGHSH